MASAYIAQLGRLLEEEFPDQQKQTVTFHPIKVNATLANIKKNLIRNTTCKTCFLNQTEVANESSTLRWIIKF